jgi:hypothetical protein
MNYIYEGLRIRPSPSQTAVPCSPTILVPRDPVHAQVDTWENEVKASSRENLLLRQQLQELTDFAGGFTVTMPKDLSLEEEQNTALRMLVRTVMANLTGEGEKDLPSLVRQLMDDNEEQVLEMRRLERRIAELDVCKEGLEKEEVDSEVIISTMIK